MKLWIEDDEGRRVECKEITAVSVPDSILIFEIDMNMATSYINEFQDRIKEATGHECVMLDKGIHLAAQISPR